MTADGAAEGVEAVAPRAGQTWTPTRDVAESGGARVVTYLYQSGTIRYSVGGCVETADPDDWHAWTTRHAATPDAPERGDVRETAEVERVAFEPTHRHVKRGTEYQVVGEAELQTATDTLVDGSTLIIYRGQDGKVWAREIGEFQDGRFESLELLLRRQPAALDLPARDAAVRATALTEIADMLQAEVDTHVHENWSYDNSTGAWETRNTASEEWVSDRDELIERIRALIPAAHPDDQVRAEVARLRASNDELLRFVQMVVDTARSDDGDEIAVVETAHRLLAALATSGTGSGE